MVFRISLLLGALLAFVPLPSRCAAQSDAAGPLRLGIIGLDTSHVPSFTKMFNKEPANSQMEGMRVVAAYPGGSQDIASSRDRVAGFTAELQQLGVEIVDSVEALLPKVDAVLLESVDGRKHLEQVLPVFKAGKPVFIDKPLAAELSDALAIDLLAKKYNARWFSSSSLRFSPGIFRYRNDPELRKQVRGASAWSPCALEPTHTDLTWYGVHGVEILYTAMGPGCQSVTRIHTAGTDLAVGVWQDGRVGEFRGLRDGAGAYGLVVFGKKQVEIGGKYEGYEPLAYQMAKFFAGGEAPVPTDETIEMFVFMQAADVSKQRGGGPVDLAEVRAEALRVAQEKVAQIDP